MTGCATMDPGLEQGSLVAHSTEGLQASQQFPVVQLPPGYWVEKVVDDLSYATSITWDGRGRMYVTEAGGHFLGAVFAPLVSEALTKIGN